MTTRSIKNTLFATLLLAWPSAWALDSRGYVDRAVELIGKSEHSLARTYLAPAVIDPRLSPGERSRAYYLRGYSYFSQGLFVSASKDFHRALEFNADNPGVMAALGDLYFRGRGVARDLELAFTLFQRAAELGHAGGQFQVGYAYLEGLGTEKNVLLARQWLNDAAEQGNATAMSYLGRSFREGYAEPPEPETARSWYEQAAEAGTVDALVALAYMHQKGEFGEPEEDRAAALFVQAADAGSSSGQVSLAHLYLGGTGGLTQDNNRARELFELAAEQGNPAGFLGLGHIYEAGLGVPADLEAARGWYQKAAAAEMPHAQLRLVYFLLADGDDTGAMHWLARAAQQDLPQAQNDYAWLLATTSDPSLRDGEKALTYAQKALASVKNAAYLDTLAAAYAELGQFQEAIETQMEAIALTDQADVDLLEELQLHLATYEAGKPWRD